MENQPAIFDRLLGLETEYALRFRSHAQADRPSTFTLFRALCDALGQQVLTVPARHGKDGVFTATGGSVWLEADPVYDESGLIEGATPECRSVRQLLAHERAQDRTLAAAARQVRLGGKMCLVKNDRDARNSMYGAQENYEAVVASGWSLFAWRASLVLLLPLVVCSWLGMFLLVLVGLAYTAVASLLYYPLSGWDESKRLATLLLGRDAALGRETGQPCPRWLCRAMNWAALGLTFPPAVVLLMAIRLFAFRKIRQQLLPHLVSRAVTSGAGMIDRQGLFHLADKAPAMNCVTGFGGLCYDRPLFCFGHFFKTAFFDACFAPRDYLDLWQPRQRLQIGLGDSNMADVAEYLRIGTTLLILDCIEAGEMPPTPRVKSPLRTMKRVITDPSLRATFTLQGGAALTAIELQRFYYDACRTFLDRRVDAPAEARDVLRRWGDVLNRLEREPHTLVGELDWVTKLYLLEQVGNDASWETKKKIDLRYHELSESGYFWKLRAAGHTTDLLAPEEIERAMRAPPPDSPATMRGHYIREFAAGDESVAASWKHVYLGDGSATKVVVLADYGRVGVPSPKGRRAKQRDTRRAP